MASPPQSLITPSIGNNAPAAARFQNKRGQALGKWRLDRSRSNGNIMAGV